MAGTCVGLGRATLGLTATAFDLVVIDEAARCLASELAVPMQAGRWIVLVGDHAQLEPQFKDNIASMVAKETGLPPSEVMRSDFERVFQSPLGRIVGRQLTLQYRMLPPIGRVVSQSFYDGLLDHGRTESPVNAAVFPETIRKAITWIHTDTLGQSAFQDPDRSGRKSLSNISEADLIVALMRSWDAYEPFNAWLTTRDDPDPAIGIICTYAAQAVLIRHKLRLASLSDPIRLTIKIDTVDSYQGKENRIVVLSLVRNNVDGLAINGIASIKDGFMARSIASTSRRVELWIDWCIGARNRWRAGSPMGKLKEAVDTEVTSGDVELLDAAESMAALYKALQDARPVTRRGISEEIPA